MTVPRGKEEAAASKCRLCGKKSRKTTDIFAPGGLSGLIEDCLRLKVEEDDGLPGVVCADCDKKLHSWRVFYDRAHQTQSQLGPLMEPTVPDISTNAKDVEKHKCLVCGEEFSRQRSFAEHLVGHTAAAGERGKEDEGADGWPCPVCGRRLKSVEGLVKHQEVHETRRNHCCHVCGRLFQTFTCLLQHLRLQHGPHAPRHKQKHACPVCKREFAQNAHLMQHLRTHTGERPYQCDQCPSHFTTTGQLQRHVAAVHEHRKRFKCTICSKEFLYGHNFKAHMSRHEGTRANKCEVCEKGFFTRNALFRHQRFHTKEKPFSCDICGKRFADCSNRKRHMQKHASAAVGAAARHQVEVVPPPELLLVAIESEELGLGHGLELAAPLSPPLPLPMELSPPLPSSPLHLPPSDFLLTLNNY